MPGEVIDRPNPQALASHIPDEVLSLSVKLEKIMGDALFTAMAGHTWAPDDD